VKIGEKEKYRNVHICTQSVTIDFMQLIQDGATLYNTRKCTPSELELRITTEIYFPVPMMEEHALRHNQ